MNEGTCRWISVEERLPIEGVFVFVRTRGDQQPHAPVYHCAGDWYGPILAYSDRDVTHWLEVLPPPPPKKLKEYTVASPIERTHRDDVAGYASGVDEVRAFIPHDAKLVKVTYEIEE